MDYYKGLISFFDILGFSKQINNKTCKEVYDLLDIFNFHSTADAHGGEDDCLRIFNFSDCIIRFIDGNEKFYPANIPFLEFINLIRIQGELINKGIVIRGGITYGEFYYDSNKHFVYGPGVVKAYNLERSAKFPRIIVDNAILERIAQDEKFKMPHHDFEYEFQEVVKVLREEECVYLDYLKIIKDEVDYIEYYYILLNKHRALIQKELENEDPTVQEKYNWLKLYHNSVVSELELGNYKI